jgi:hypothetical protein
MIKGIRASGSASAKIRRSFLTKGGDAFGVVEGLSGKQLKLTLGVEGLLVGAVERAPERTTGQFVGLGWTRRQSSGQEAGLTHNRFSRRHAVDEPPLKRLARAKTLAKEQHFRSTDTADGARKQV